MTTALSARLTGSARTIDPRAWDALAHPRGRGLAHPFTRHTFFTAVEESGSATARTGWQPVHLVLEDGEQILALMPLYLKSHSFGEYVFDHGWADAFERAGGRYYPKLQACVPFTPATGPKLLTASQCDRNSMRKALLRAALNAMGETDASSLHITFLPEDEWILAAGNGFLTRTDQQFHWHNRGYGSFDDFLADLASAKRKTLRKERAAVRGEGICFEWLTGRDLTESVWDAFFECYTTTGNQKWNPPYLTREFFSLVGENMGEQILLVMAKRAGRYVAGALNFFDDTAIYGRNWGCVEQIPFLHFETCYYQAIDFAIKRKLERVEAGAQGGHKLLRGYLPSATYSAHAIAHTGLRRAVADYLDRERPAVIEHMEELRERAPFRKDSSTRSE